MIVCPLLNQVIVEMLIEFIGICQHCAGEIKILSLDGITIEDCSSCGQLPFIIKKVNGIIYILSNDHQIGVKIGLTKKTLEQRIKSLESTGVPGKFNKSLSSLLINQRLMKSVFMKNYVNIKYQKNTFS